ncbi:MAG: putative baseplate assembly protein [Chloroflexota bacterium]
MGFETPRLDDRSFNDIVEEARARIPLYTPEWTDHNLSDPGITLIELFAWMTDIVLYRLNRVPDKHYVKFMELIGMRLEEAEPARAEVTFWLSAPQPNSITLPNGTEVSTTRTETEPAIIFSTDGAMEIKVPKLSHVMTSSGAEEGRSFTIHNAANVQNALEKFPVFASKPPTNNDALYLGFEEDISNHILGIQIEVDVAEGAGVDPNHPPYIWEVMGSSADQAWVRLDVDYDSTLGLNIGGIIRLHLPQLRRASRNDQLAYWIRLRLEYSDGETSYNVSPQVNKLEVSSWGGTIGATNVTRVYKEVLGRSDGTPGQRFYLAHQPVIARSASEDYLIIKHEDGREERWQEVADFSSSTANDKHYTIDSGTGEVRLGPAMPQRDGSVHRFGALPAKNTMLLMSGYRYGGGLVGNVAANSLNVLKTALPYIDHVINRISASGGKNAEDIDYAKTRVPGYLRTLQRAVTTSDFEYLAREAAPGQVGRVFCLQPPQTNRGEIQILAIPQIPRLQGFIAPESLELNEELRNTIQTYLDERRLLSTMLSVTPPAYQWVETEVRLRAVQHYDVEKVRQAVETRLFEFINPLVGGIDGKGWPFGRDLFISDVMAMLSSVEGVSFIRSVKLYPINYDKRWFTRSAEAQEILLPAHGVVVSYQHNVVVE